MNEESVEEGGPRKMMKIEEGHRTFYIIHFKIYIFT